MRSIDNDIQNGNHRHLYLLFGNMIDWNNDGKVDGEDWMLTEMMLDDEKGGGGSFEKPNGSCLASFLLILIVPMVGVSFIGYLMM